MSDRSAESSSSRPSTVAVIGMGRVGVASAYAMLIQGLADRLALIDIDAPKRHAEALDLMHGLTFVPNCEVSEGDLDAAADSDVVVITAGAKQKKGQSRLDLAETNAAILRDMIPRLVELAPRSIILMVTNPVDVMTMVAHDIAVPLGFAASRILTTGTLLDSSRFRALLARRLDVAVSSVHASIVGEHGDSSLPLWSSATVGHTPLHFFEPRGKRALTVRDRVEIFESVRGAAQEIIAGKGATDSAIGLTVARLCRAILRDERAVLTVGSVHGQAPTGVVMEGPACFSLPSVVGRGGVARVVREVPMNDAERAGLGESIRIIRAAHARVRPL